MKGNHVDVTAYGDQIRQFVTTVATTTDPDMWYPRYAPMDTRVQRDPTPCVFCGNPRFTDDNGGCASCGAPLSKEDVHILLPSRVKYTAHEEYTIWERIERLFHREV